MNNRGKLAELKAAIYLEEHKYKLVDFNYICRFGEIDIIAKNRKYIAFIEVKMRDENSTILPREFVDENKQKKIIACAESFLSKHPTSLQPRFDVVQVIIEDGKVLSIDYITNAYDTTGYNFIF